jgi:ElaB/YqjD/DUF883 family membrane-anchored ribosome-binding protein
MVWCEGGVSMVRRRILQTLQQDLDVLSAELSDLAADPPDDPSLALDELRERINRVREDVEKVTSESNSPSPALAMADKIVDPIEDTLSERPVATIALGLGLGFLYGLVWRWR